MSFVRCWGEPTRLAYQQSDLLIMDLVEKRMDTLYAAALLFDYDKLTSEQFWDRYKQQGNSFAEEVNRRFNGQWSASAPTPATAPTPAPRYYK